MKKKEIKALEKVFAAEIENRLPFQSKAKIYNQLKEKGLLYFVTYTLGGIPPMKINGYVLTEIGRYEYCKTCK